MSGNLDEAIFKYAREGDLDGVKNCLANGIEIKSRSKEMHMDGMSLIQMACSFGQEHVVRFLLEKDKTTLYDRAGTGWLPIHYAAESGNIEILKLLLAKAKDPESLLEATVNEGWCGCTPLHIAAVTHQVAAMKYLIAKGAKRDAVNWLGYTPLKFGLSEYAKKDQLFSTLALRMDAYFNGAQFQPEKTAEEIVVKAEADNTGIKLHQNVGLACAVAFLGIVLLNSAPAENDSLKIVGSLMIAFGIFVMTNKGGVAVNNVARSADRFVEKIGDGAKEGLKKGMALAKGKVIATFYGPPVKVDAQANVNPVIRPCIIL